MMMVRTLIYYFSISSHGGKISTGVRCRTAVSVRPTAYGLQPKACAAGQFGCGQAAALCTLLLALCLATGAAASSDIYVGHGIAMHGDLKYPPGFTHFAYVNRKAPKGGEMRQAAIGTFDSFNPFIIRGNSAAGVGRIYDTLLTTSADEPFSEYGLLAEKVEMPLDRSSVTFTLRPNARWHDGKPVSVDDVIWSFNTLREKGLPFFRAYYASIESVEKSGERGVKFTFSAGENRELPLILGQFPIFPRHYWSGRDFDKTTLEPPLGSGPYKIDSFEAGRYVTYARVPDYWGKDLPVNSGRHNFDRVRIDYYRDSTVALEAFKAGEYDLRPEESAKNWATAYDFPAVRTRAVRKEEIPHDRPAGMQGFVFNARRPIFEDRRVRQALAHAFDFEWSNRTLFYGQYTRTRSYFDNSELAAQDLPSQAELAVLEPYRGRLPEEVFTKVYEPPATDGSGNIRDNLRTATKLLREAGWAVDAKTRKLTHTETGRVMEFEILLNTPLFERIALPFVKNLERLGITANVRTVDTAQYQRRTDSFDFDMVTNVWLQSLSPGNEQRDFWGSAYAKRPGSRNLIGIEDPVVDGLIEAVIAAPDRSSLVTRVRALDRVLQWGHWVIPQWHIPVDRIAYWNKFGRPEVTPAQGVQFDTWWIDAERTARLERLRHRPRR
jgi:microcin C transport system substrate-binding protein